MTGLQRLHSVEDVAAALGVTPYYVKQQCRRRAWPHRRPNRNQIAFSDADFAQILEITAEPVADTAPATGLAFAPRSRRGAA